MNLRWEWRAFGERFGAAESRLGSLHVEGVVESDETYLLSAQCRDAVKVRAGLMDVKHLERVDDDGLELIQLGRSGCSLGRHELISSPRSAAGP
jgi:exopolyphosphatase/guanosine-5'-triphosphate,3'-diphosphate pyrophosphatase